MVEGQDKLLFLLEDFCDDFQQKRCLLEARLILKREREEINPNMDNESFPMKTDG